MRRYARRRDACEPSIIIALEQAGCAVTRNSDDGVPDLTVSYRGIVDLIECKDRDSGIATRVAHRRNHDADMPGCLTETQCTWWRRWLSAGGRRPHIVYTPAEALAAIGNSTVATDGASVTR